ncbi:MAG: YceI family protein [Planctomycetes bacterium]|nr:YceI family protein [Planctomycetota bacterium]
MGYRGFLLAGLLLSAAVHAAGAEQTFAVGAHGPKHVNVTIESDTDLEAIVTTSNQAAGQVVWDRDAKTGSVKLSVPVNSLRTGIDKRDEHLQGEGWLDAAKNPDISFASTAVKHVKDDEYEIAGTFTLKGVAKEVKANATVKYIAYKPEFEKMGLPKGNLARFSVALDLKLSDFEIKSPAIPAKVSDTLKVKLALMGVEEIKE